MNEANGPHAPVGLLDVPLDLDRIIQFWRTLPESRADDESAEVARIEFEANQIFQAVSSGLSALEALNDDDYEYFSDEIGYLLNLEPDEFARFRSDLLALATDPEGASTCAVVLDGDLEHFAEVLIWTLRGARPDRFLPTARGIGIHHACCEAETPPERAIAIGNARLVGACARNGLTSAEAWDFAMWLTKLEQIVHAPTDRAGERAAKDLLWQLVAPTGKDPDVVRERDGATLLVESGFEFADTELRDPYDLLESQSAPCRIVTGSTNAFDARFMFAAADWAWDDKDSFGSGHAHAILCGSVSPLKHAYILQMKLRRLIPDRPPARVTLSHKPVWLKRDGRNAERKSAWLAAMRAVGVPIQGQEAIHGHFLPTERRFTEPAHVVRDRIILELVVRTAFEDALYLELLEALAPAAARAIRDEGAEPDDHGLLVNSEEDDDEDEEDGNDEEVDEDEELDDVEELDESDVDPQLEEAAVQTPQILPAAISRSARIDRLLGSEIFARQCAQLRAPLPADRIRLILGALEASGGLLTRSALERHSGISSLRLQGMLPLLRRLLNLDGVDVMRIDDEAATISVDFRLLDAQFRTEEST